MATDAVWVEPDGLFAGIGVDLDEVFRRIVAQAEVGTVASRYDADSDTVLVHLFGAARPAVSVPVGLDGRFYLRVDPETREVVGIHLEDFLSVLVAAVPALLGVAEALGIDARTASDLRRKRARRATTSDAVRLLRPFVIAGSAAKAS